MVGLARVNGDDKLVRGLSDAMVESTVNVLISDVVITEGNSGVVVTATVGVISSSKLLSVIKFITLSVDWLVIDTTSGVVIDEANDVVNVTVESDCITVSITVSVLNALVVDGVLLTACTSSEGDGVTKAVKPSNVESVGADDEELTTVIKLLNIGSGILVDVTSTPSTVEVTSDTNNVSVVSKLLLILLDITISVDCISDEEVVIVDKLLILTTSVNNTVELVIG